MNSVRVGRGPSYEHHVKTYGADFPYNRFAEQFKAEAYAPGDWAALFARSGAKYVVPVTKHHDGFCLWDTRYSDFNSLRLGPRRDLIGELAAAVKGAGLRFGVYYSGILDWQYAQTPITDNDDLYNPPNVTAAYADYAFNQVMELIDLYEPEVLWNDIAWPKKGLGDLPTLFSYYYNRVPGGVVNDRWSGVWHDFTTKEYKHGAVDLVNKWEMCRGLGLSFAYNREEGEDKIIGSRDLVRLLVRTVSHNGNLLINVGPMADGTIPPVQARRLLDMGAWLDCFGEAIFDTEIWERQHDRLAGGAEVYYSQSAAAVYAILDGARPGGDYLLPGLGGCAARASALGGARLRCTAEGEDLRVHVEAPPAELPAETAAVLALRLAKD